MKNDIVILEDYNDLLKEIVKIFGIYLVIDYMVSRFFSIIYKFDKIKFHEQVTRERLRSLF